MTRAVELLSSEKRDWDDALPLYRGQLNFYLDYLLQCECRHQVLAGVEAEVRERSVPEEFKYRFLIRTLIRAVIQHLHECTRSGELTQASPDDVVNAVTDIPDQERLVYFMRDILEYSTRDTSLLIGTTDSETEALLRAARKRIDILEGPSSIEIETPDWTYFRWKFVDLHLGH